MRNKEQLILWLLIAAALLFRVAHMGGPIDVPDWRQAETAYMTFRMFEEQPPEILHSKVPYRGAKDVHLAEFPVQPFVTSLLYKVAGGENLILARSVALFFFIGATAFLYALASRVFSREVALYGVAIFAWLPLGVFYSRAVHVDFCIIFFSHAYLYFAVRFFERRVWRYYCMAVAMATVAFLMKAPYCFYLALPLLAYVFYEKSNRTVFNLLLIGAVFIIPLIAGWAFHTHRIALEAHETDSLVYPMKWTAELSHVSFFGDLSQRLDPERWKALLRRVFTYVGTPMGVVLAGLGLLGLTTRISKRDALVVGSWCVGIAVYVLTVFPIVTTSHDYYSLPILAPMALLIACGIKLIRGASGMIRSWRAAVALGVVIVFASLSARALETDKYYFTKDWQRLKAGEEIRRLTTSDDLVLSLTKGRSTGWSDPRILYYANRRGWAIELDRLDDAALNQYLSAGANKAALLLTPAYHPQEIDFGILSSIAGDIYVLKDQGDVVIGWLVMFDLQELPTSNQQSAISN